ncbi:MULTISPECIES: hypothetical protein [unclassified Nostoc]|uniref:hypothetical protein n=1 Tax=unclassified Nostoc TaxID=2593658 RepID=UPI002609365C|nr:hypothetical protein [Nostoc sp. S13]
MINICSSSTLASNFSHPMTQWYLRTTAQVSGDRTNNYIRPGRASSLNVAIKFF